MAYRLIGTSTPVLWCFLHEIDIWRPCCWSLSFQLYFILIGVLYRSSSLGLLLELVSLQWRYYFVIMSGILKRQAFSDRWQTDMPLAELKAICVNKWLCSVISCFITPYWVKTRCPSTFLVLWFKTCCKIYFKWKLNRFLQLFTNSTKSLLAGPLWGLLLKLWFDYHGFRCITICRKVTKKEKKITSLWKPWFDWHEYGPF